jgi:hypothetical protein
MFGNGESKSGYQLFVMGWQHEIPPLVVHLGVANDARLVDVFSGKADISHSSPHERRIVR